MSAGKVLVVDDEPQIRRVMRVILAGENYEVMEARSGEAALLRFREFLPDLVLLDLNMPGMNGLETCRNIRDTSDVPIIVLTVRREEEEKVEALDAGADDYVTKPFGKQEPLARIRAALRRSPASSATGPRTFVSSDLEIDFETRRVAPEMRDDRLAVGGAIVGMDRLDDVAGGQRRIFRLHPQHLAQLLGKIDFAALEVGVIDRVIDGLHRERIALLDAGRIARACL